MFAYALASKPCSEATNIGSILSLGADFGWGCLCFEVIKFVSTSTFSV